LTVFRLEQPFPGHHASLNVELPYIGFLPMSTWLNSKTKFRMYSQPSRGNFEKSLTMSQGPHSRGNGRC